MKPLYIFDLDGTLALTEHRQHLLDSKCPECRGCGRLHNGTSTLVDCDECCGTGGEVVEYCIEAK